MRGIVSESRTVSLPIQPLLDVFRETHALLARRDNDFTWSSWEDAPAALKEIDDLMSRLESGSLPPRNEMEMLFLPTGPIQEVSLSSGWGSEFLSLADRFDAAVEDG